MSAALADRYGTPWTANATEIRSVALANQHQMTAGAVRYAWGAPDGWETFRALSERTHRYEYEVAYHIASDRVCHCTCPAGERGIACKHRGAARLWIERRRARITFRDEAESAGHATYEPTELLSA